MGEVHEVCLDGRSLTPRDLARVAHGARCILAPEARDRMLHSARWYAENGPSDIILRKWQWLGATDAPAESADRVRSFIESHCSGVGAPLPDRVVRALAAARANVLATGATGSRPEIADGLLRMLDEGWVPVIPSQGSIGSAAPAPLAHLARVVCGFGGTVRIGGKEVPASEVVTPVVPSEKEALALLNGSTLTSAWGALCVDQARWLLDVAEGAAALSFETVRADLHCLSEAALSARNHPGAVGVAHRLRSWLDGSQLVAEGRRPDAFSIRCTPIVLGGVHDALDFVEQVLTRELNGACDNPVVLPESGVIEAGNFHAAPVALVLDLLKTALLHVLTLSERRVFRLTHGQLSGLPSFLSPDTGLNSGMMLAQYTAASIVSEARGLTFPASVDTIPTVQHLEDHASMGPIAASGLDRILDLAVDVLSIELLVGAQGMEFHLRNGLKAGTRTTALWNALRESVPFWTRDRFLHADLQAVRERVSAGTLPLTLDSATR